jgi:hypothetical protein
MTGNDVAVLLSFLAAAVALAGFAGIVTSIDRRTAMATDEVISFRVRNLVLAAVLSVMLAMQPILLDALQLLPMSLWQFACMTSAISQIWLLIHQTQNRFRMKAAGRDSGLSRPLFAFNTTMAAAGFLVTLFGASGILPGRGAYFVGLFYLQYLMCSLFYRIIVVADEAARRTAPSSSA